MVEGILLFPEPTRQRFLNILGRKKPALASLMPNSLNRFQRIIENAHGPPSPTCGAISAGAGSIAHPLRTPEVQQLTVLSPQVHRYTGAQKNRSLSFIISLRVNFLAKSDYFTTPGVKGRAMAAFFRGVGQLPMDRSGGQKSQESLNAGGQVLKDGGIIGIYPEGTRSPDGRGYRPKVGVARLALETGVPVVPVGQIGTDLIQPSGSNRVRLRHDGKPIQVRTIIGNPLSFEEYTDGSDMSHRVQREIADRIGSEIRALSGQEYVDVYADRVKKIMTDKNMSADAAVAHLQH